MSDIGTLNDPLSLTVVALLLGAIAGALAWRRRRMARVGRSAPSPASARG